MVTYWVHGVRPDDWDAKDKRCFSGIVFDIAVKVGGPVLVHDIVPGGPFNMASLTVTEENAARLEELLDDDPWVLRYSLAE